MSVVVVVVGVKLERVRYTSVYVCIVTFQFRIFIGTRVHIRDTTHEIQCMNEMCKSYNFSPMSITPPSYFGQISHVLKIELFFRVHFFLCGTLKPLTRAMVAHGACGQVLLHVSCTKLVST